MSLQTVERSFAERASRLSRQVHDQARLDKVTGDAWSLAK